MVKRLRATPEVLEGISSFSDLPAAPNRHTLVRGKNDACLYSTSSRAKRSGSSRRFFLTERVYPYFFTLE